MLIAGLIFIFSCKIKSVNKPLKIALSWGSDNYKNWVHMGDSTAEVIDMRGMQTDSALKLLAGCDAIMFTGGEDVDPTYYGCESDSARCKINPERDTLEFALIKEAFRLKLPILGVCRGQQILNIALGGNLIVDIPADHPGNVIHQIEDYLHCFHEITVVKESQLYKICKADTGMVNSNHHQAIKNPAPGIRIAAWSKDSIAEAMEWADPKGKPFFVTVQWHPERMDITSSFSMPLINAFLEEAKVFSKKK